MDFLRLSYGHEVYREAVGRGMHTVASFHGSAVKPDELSGIMADYLALERATLFRRLLMKRFGVLAAIFAGISFYWLSAFASWCGVGLCMAAPAWAWMIELGCERRLARRLDEVPGRTVHVIDSAAPKREPLVKKS